MPFDGDSPVAVAMQHLHAKPAPIESIAPDVPPAIIHVCMMAMEKNPKYRYQSAMEMAAELRLALEGRTDQMQPRLVETPRRADRTPAAHCQRGHRHSAPQGSRRQHQRHNKPRHKTAPCGRWRRSSWPD